MVKFQKQSQLPPTAPSGLAKPRHINALLCFIFWIIDLRCRKWLACFPCEEPAKSFVAFQFRQIVSNATQCKFFFLMTHSVDKVDREHFSSPIILAGIHPKKSISSSFRTGKRQYVQNIINSQKSPSQHGAQEIGPIHEGWIMKHDSKTGLPCSQRQHTSEYQLLEGNRKWYLSSADGFPIMWACR